MRYRTVSFILFGLFLFQGVSAWAVNSEDREYQELKAIAKEAGLTKEDVKQLLGSGEDGELLAESVKPKTEYDFKKLESWIFAALALAALGAFLYKIRKKL